MNESSDLQFSPPEGVNKESVSTSRSVRVPPRIHSYPVEEHKERSEEDEDRTLLPSSNAQTTPVESTYSTGIKDSKDAQAAMQADGRISPRFGRPAASSLKKPKVLIRYRENSTLPPGLSESLMESIVVDEHYERESFR